jgi:hypothetical protein
MIAALIISALGMPLLFLALAVFYGLLTLLASTIRDRQSTPPQPVEGETAPAEDEALLQAAAIAVAVARAGAEQTSSFARVEVGNGIEAASQPLSPWWTLHHQRKMIRGRNLRRSQ